MLVMTEQSEKNYLLFKSFVKPKIQEIFSMELKIIPVLNLY